MALRISKLDLEFGSKVLLQVIAVSTLALLLNYYVLRSIYRITLHPLAKFPGPKLPAITRWYEAYYEVFVDGTGGKFGEKVEEWHKQYGPIIRINPFELHVDDPDYYDTLFNHDPHLWKRSFAIGRKLDAGKVYSNSDKLMQTTSSILLPPHSIRSAVKCSRTTSHNRALTT